MENSTATKIPKGTKGKRSKAQIEKAILSLIQDKGINGFKLSDICDETQMTIGAFYFHYKNKDAALDEVAANCVREMYDDLANAPTQINFDKEIESIITQYVKGYIEPEKISHTMLIHQRIPNSNSLYLVWLESRSHLVKRLEAVTIKTKKNLGLPIGNERFTIEYLFSGAEGFLENLYFGSDNSLKKATGKPKNVIDKLSVIWRSALMS